MIQKFFDWINNLSSEKSSFVEDTSIRKAPLSPVPAFSNKAYTPPAIDTLPTQDIQKLLEEHLENAYSEEGKEHITHLQEALSIATKNSSVLSGSQKGAAISSLIGEQDAKLLIHLLRWKDGITCPFCGSENVTKLMGRGTHQYKCADCSGGDYNGEFDELTGYFAKGDWHSARIWVLINYLKIFMPLGKIAKVLGLSLDQALQIMSMMQPEALSSKHNKKKKNGPISFNKENT